MHSIRSCHCVLNALKLPQTNALLTIFPKFSLLHAGTAAEMLTCRGFNIVHLIAATRLLSRFQPFFPLLLPLPVRPNTL